MTTKTKTRTRTRTQSKLPAKQPTQQSSSPDQAATSTANCTAGLAAIDPHAPQDELILTAQRKITLQCGQSSITLHPNGKIILRGEYILSVAEGTNRMVGGQIEIN